MFLLLFIRNVYFITNILLICHFTSTDEICITDSDGLHLPKFVKLIDRWIPWIVVVLVEIDIIMNLHYYKHKSLFDAAFIVQCSIFCIFTLILAITEDIYQYLNRHSDITDPKVVCSPYSPLQMVKRNFNVILGLILCFTYCMKKSILRLEKSLRRLELSKDKNNPETAAAAAESVPVREESGPSRISPERETKPASASRGKAPGRKQSSPSNPSPRRKRKSVKAKRKKTPSNKKKGASKTKRKRSKRVK